MVRIVMRDKESFGLHVEFRQSVLDDISGVRESGIHECWRLVVKEKHAVPPAVQLRYR